MIYCSFCACDPEKDTLHEALLKIKGCNNCMADITLSGDWTGHGRKAILDLIEKHGKEKVAKAAKAVGL